jgi:hypothetical protein
VSAKSSEQYSQELAAAIAPVFGDEMVTKWVFLCEVMDGDGRRATYLLSQPDARVWDSLGLLMFGLQVEQARTVVEYIERDED